MRCYPGASSPCADLRWHLLPVFKTALLHDTHDCWRPGAWNRYLRAYVQRYFRAAANTALLACGARARAYRH